MSLLLDALKRAEQEKLARQPAGAAAPPVSAAAPRATKEASLELQPLAPPAGAAQGAAPARPEAAAAQNVFQAKSKPAPEAGRSRAMLWVIVGAVALVAMGAAGYVWYSVKSLTPQYAGMARPAPIPPPATSAPQPSPAAIGSIVAAPETAAATASPAGQSSAQAAALEPAASARPGAPAAPPPAPPETPAERLARAAAEAPAPPPLQLARAQAAGRVPAEVAAGYDALRKGEWATARRAYRSALAADPGNVDIHLGLATLAAFEADRAAALEHYRRALQLDPGNPTALAGLASLADLSRPEALEVQLRADLDRAPDSPALHFALGNLYSTQGRWTEAQAAYYDAHRLDPGSPEIAHNLAVSLDRLGQRTLAAGFYHRALDAARARASAVDTAAVARRLAEIE